MKKKKGLSIGLTIGIIVILLAIFPGQMIYSIGYTLGTIEVVIEAIIKAPTPSFIIAGILTLVIVGGIIYLLYFVINKILNLKKN